MPASEPPCYTDPLPTACWSLNMGLVLWSTPLSQQACKCTLKGDGDQWYKVGSDGRNDSGENIGVCEEIDDSLCFTKEQQKISLFSAQAQ